MSNNEIKKSIISEVIGSLKPFKETCGILIGTSFSIIIFSLSLIPVRTLLLEIGILCLLLAIIFLFEVFRFITGYSYKVEYKIPSVTKRFYTKFYLGFLNDCGILFFFLGLLFITAHFSIEWIIIIFCIYLLFRATRFVMWRIYFLRKEFRAENQRKHTNIRNTLHLLYSIVFLIITLGIIFYVLCEVGIYCP